MENKIKFSIYLCLAIICILMAALSFGMTGDNINLPGGRSGIFSLVVLFFVRILEPIFGGFSASMIYLSISIPFVWLAIKKQRLIRSVKNDDE